MPKVKYAARVSNGAKNRVALNTKIDAKLKKKAKARAKKEGLTISAWVEGLIQGELAAVGGEVRSK